MNLYSAIVAAIAIWAVVRITQHWLAARDGESAAERDAAHKAEVEELEARVRNLERILTDRRESLERKFDDL
ncbi:MAG: hypothetical protein ACNS61_09675 [Candidatus Wenzhouxiangella sp. M2_3B_020]